jgi:Glycosyltransferase family 87
VSVFRGRTLPPLLVMASAGVLLAGVIALILSPVMDNVTRPPFVGIDWRSYVETANRFLAGHSLYDPRQLVAPYSPVDVAPVGYLYAPPTILVFVPFLVLGPVAWAAANALLLATGIGAMAWRDFGRHAAIAAGVAFGVLAVGQPYRQAVVVGNINLGLAGLFAWAWAIRGQPRLTGLVAGIGALVKLHPIALLALASPQSRVRTALAAVVVIALATIVSLPIVGLTAWGDYLTALANVRPLCGVGSNVLTCALEPVVGPMARVGVLLIAALIVLVALAARNDLLRFALLVLAIFVPLPEMFPHTLLYADVLLFATVCFAYAHLARRSEHVVLAG